MDNLLTFFEDCIILCTQNICKLRQYIIFLHLIDDIFTKRSWFFIFTNWYISLKLYSSWFVLEHRFIYLPLSSFFIFVKFLLRDQHVWTWLILFLLCYVIVKPNKKKRYIIISIHCINLSRRTVSSVITGKLSSLP